ncbi:MAG: ComEA family DNA-binding protein [bacterium]
MKDTALLRLFALGSLLTTCLLSGASGQQEYEDLLETDGETSDQSELLERIAELRQHPIDLNTAPLSELQRIPWLTPIQSQHIVKQREKSGRFRSVSGLLDLPGFDEQLLAKIGPFVSVEAEARSPLLSWRLRSRIIHGASTDEAEGDRFLFREKVYTRNELNVADKLKIGILTEKDADEENLGDHAVSYVSLDELGLFSRIISGNYRLDFGQGLVLGDYSGALKGASFPSSLKKRERGLRAYTSTSEVGPFLGLACSGSVKGVSFSLFGSKTDVDATLNDDGTVSSIYESGLHRTETERRKKDVLKEQLYGGHISYGQGSWGSVGVTFYHSRYDHPFDPKDEERKHYTFRGRTNSVGGLHFDLYYRRLNIFGETGKAEGAGTGMLVAAIIDFGRIEVDALMRDYDRDFYNLHNYGFAEKPDETQNESGTLFGLVYNLDGRTRMKVYFDRVRNPWRRYYEQMPPARREFWSQIEHQAARSVLTTLRMRVKTKDTYETIADGVSKNTRRRQVNARGQLDWQFSKKGRWRGRLERVWVRYPDLSTEEAGWVLFGDLRFIPKKWVTVDNRLIFFNTGSYDSRIYEYENDLPGLMTNVGLYGEGVRWYALARLKLGPALRMSFKYSITHFHETNREDDHRFGLQLEFNPTL